MKLHQFFCFGAVLGGGVFGGSCATLPATEGGSYRAQWSRTLEKGAPSHVSVSADGRRILVLTSGVRESFAVLYDDAGAELGRIRKDDVLLRGVLSADGSWFAISSERATEWYTSSGERIHAIPVTCRPILMQKPERIFCATTAEGVAIGLTAFQVFAKNGELLLKSGERKVITHVARSEVDGVAYTSFSGGHLSAYNREMKRIWSRKMAGEVIDLAVQDIGRGSVAVLFLADRGADRGKHVVEFFSSTGRQTSRLVPGLHVGAVRFDRSGRLMLYGNGPRGQVLAVFARDATGGEKLLWQIRDPRFADFYHDAIPYSDGVLVGIEHEGRLPELVYLNADGKKIWTSPIETQEGGYLLGVPPSIEGQNFYVVTDRQRLIQYEKSNQ